MPHAKYYFGARGMRSPLCFSHSPPESLAKFKTMSLHAECYFHKVHAECALHSISIFVVGDSLVNNNCFIVILNIELPGLRAPHLDISIWACGVCHSSTERGITWCVPWCIPDSCPTHARCRSRCIPRCSDHVHVAGILARAQLVQWYVYILLTRVDL